LLLVPLFFLLALFSKESALLTAGLGLLVTFWVWPRYRPTTGAWLVMVLCALLAVGWLLIREQITAPVSGAYEMRLGSNAARNSLSLFLFFFNVPREALRFVVTEKSVTAGLWGAACFALQALAFWLFVRDGSHGLTKKGTGILALIVIVSCAPYLLLAWNSYAYYITLALMVWPILIALSSATAKAKAAAVAAALLSSGLALAGNLTLDYPSLLGRASWARDQIPIIHAALKRRPEILYVRTGSYHKYMGLGPYGLAYILDMERGQIIELSPEETPPRGARVLVIPADGDVAIEQP
jgi:hypothetical protein